MFRILLSAIATITLACSSSTLKSERTPASDKGNRGFIVTDADTALRVRWDLLNREDKEILANFHMWDPDGFGGYSLALMCLKAQAGMPVRLVINGDGLNIWGGQRITGALVKIIGETCRHKDKQTMFIRFWNPVEVKGIQDLFNSKTKRRDHDKILYLEGQQIAYEGDRNWQNVNVRQASHRPGVSYVSVDAVVQGPVVADVRKYVEEVWEQAEDVTPKMITKKEKVRVMGNGAHKTTMKIPIVRSEYFQEEYDEKKAIFLQMMKDIVDNNLNFTKNDKYQNISWTEKMAPMESVRFLRFSPEKKLKGIEDDSMNLELLNMISSAEKSVYLSTPFLHLPKRYFDTIQAARDRGVEVSLLTSNPDSYLVPHIYRFQNADIKRLEKMGVKTYMTTGTDPHHAKVIISDNRRVYIGTHNFNRRSEELDLDTGFLIDDPGVGATVQDFFNANSEGYKRKNGTSHFLLMPLVKPLLYLPFIDQQRL